MIARPLKDARIGLLEVLLMAALGHAIFEWMGISTLPPETHGQLSSGFSSLMWSYVVILGCGIWAAGVYKKAKTWTTHIATIVGIAINLVTMILVFNGAASSDFGLTVTIFSAVFVFQLIEALINSVLVMIDDVL